MDMFKRIFGEIDFSDTGVQALFVALVVLTALVVVTMFFVFKLVIPKSKLQDLESIDRAINRLERLMFFDKIILSIGIITALILAVLHVARLIDAWKTPLIWVVVADAAIMPIALVAVFGKCGTSANQRKLDDLRRRRNMII